VTAFGAWTGTYTTFATSFARSGQVWSTLAPISGGHLQANFDNVVISPGSEACLPDLRTLCLVGSRFKVTATFDTGVGTPADAQAIPIGKSGYLWFFDSNNVEVVVKVLDGCALSGHFWFYAAGLTNLDVVITVTDMQTKAVRTYSNPANTPFEPIQDTSAFDCP